MKKIILPAVLCSALIASAAANIPVSAANLTDHISTSDSLNMPIPESAEITLHGLLKTAL